MTSRRSEFMHKPFGFLVWALLGCLAMTALVALTCRVRATSPDTQVFILSGSLAPSEGRLPVFTRVGDSLRLSAGSAEGDSGTVVSSLGHSEAVRLWIGDYLYRLRPYRIGRNDLELSWRLEGVRLRVGDEVGRSPLFYFTKRLSYEPDKVVLRANGVKGRALPLWMDSMPSRLLVVRSAADCMPAISSPCLELTGGRGRVTVESPAIGAGQAARFTHIDVGSLFTVGADEVLWVGHLPFEIRVDSQSRLRLRLRDHYVDYRGERGRLGELALSGRTGRIPDGGRLEFQEFGTLMTGSRLPEYFWTEQEEDEYQLLIDNGLLCTELRVIDGRTTPQLRFRSPGEPPCTALLPGSIAPAETSVDAGVMGILSERMADNRLVRVANRVFREERWLARPDSLPFTFEWWMSSVDGALVPVPLAVWGTRTQATLQHEHPPATPLESRQVELRSRSGEAIVLAASAGGSRVYAGGESLLGLGPVLGIRDYVDGLDAIVDKLPGGDAPVVLTIDPDLQRELWRRTKDYAQVRGLSSDQTSFHPSGISAVALNPETGAILAAVSWPAGTWFENGYLTKRLGKRFGSAAQLPTLNDAMARADRVGSVQKLLAVYAMANAGLLDSAGREASASCDKRPFGVLITDDQGRARRGGSLFEDDQPGPLPVGRDAMAGGLGDATGHSCNTYFALAATMLLGDMPDVRYAGRCPIDDRLTRTDLRSESAGSWIVCATDRALTARLGQTLDPEKSAATWLLLPRIERLLPRAEAALQRSAEEPGGYYGVAAQAGYYFLFTPAHPGTPQESAPLGRWIDKIGDVHYRRDWLAGVPFEVHQTVFAYPALYSPVSVLGSLAGIDTEAYDGTPRKVAAADRGWRDFASQAIGEGGMGSALSIATLYSAVARDDGAVAAPQLLSSQAGANGSRRAFEPSAVRLRAIRDALRRPVSGDGTAARLGEALGIDAFRGKTGTFRLERKTRKFSTASASSGESPWVFCGIPELSNNGELRRRGADWNAALGSRYCDDEQGLFITGVHRYPAVAPAEPKFVVLSEAEKGTSFAGVFLGEGARPPVVLAVVCDVRGGCPHLRDNSLLQGLLSSVWQWANSPR